MNLLDTSILTIANDEKEFIEPAQEFDLTFDPGQRTALHLAIAHTHPEVVGVLLKHKGY